MVLPHRMESWLAVQLLIGVFQFRCNCGRRNERPFLPTQAKHDKRLRFLPGTGEETEKAYASKQECRRFGHGRQKAVGKPRRVKVEPDDVCCRRCSQHSFPAVPPRDHPTSCRCRRCKGSRGLHRKSRSRTRQCYSRRCPEQKFRVLPGDRPKSCKCCRCRGSRGLYRKNQCSSRQCYCRRCPEQL